MVLLQLMELVASVSEKGPQVVAVARSEHIELLRALYQSERVDPYEDTLDDGSTVTKKFSKGGVLEMYLPLQDESQMLVDLGTKEDRIQSMIQELTERINTEWDAIVANTISCADGNELISIVRRTSNKVGETNVG